MTRRLHITLIGLFVGLFLTVQITSTAHAVHYDDVPHEHDEVVCLLGAVVIEDQAVEPLTFATKPKIQSPALPYETDFTSATYITPQGRAPPPRSPPLTFL